MQRILILVVFVISNICQAQIKSQIYVDGGLHDTVQFSDSLALRSHIDKLQFEWVNSGFYFSGLDSIVSKPHVLGIYLHRGEQYSSKIDGISGKKLYNRLSRELKFYTNNGFPFASVSLDSLSILNFKLTGYLSVNSGPEITYDSAFFFNSLKTNHSYVYQLLDIVPGEKFSARSIDALEKKVDRSPFLSLQRPTDLSFRDEKAKVFLDLEEETSNSFQGVLGLQQSGAGNTSLVGNIDLEILNLFSSGKQFGLSWERFSEQSQELDLYYKHPFILGSKISPSLRLNILKQDTSFLTRTTGIGLNTFIGPSVELFIEYEQANGSLISADIDELARSGLADYRRSLYELMLSKGNPASLERYSDGVIWNLSIAAGKKSIDQNVNIPDSYYDTIQINTDFYRFETFFSYQKTILKRQSLFLSFNAGELSNGELLRNELYRLGGLRSLRGFNEKSIFANRYLLSRMEFRSFFENRSYAFLFYDQLFFEEGDFFDMPNGFGLGFTLGSSSGQFSFAFALGRSKSQPVSFSTVKAHFGYIARF